MHNFHIPVMGLGFTIDTPLKVAHYGINSVISIVDDDLIEKMRMVHCTKNNIKFIPVSIKEKDYRAKRITLYLDMINDLVKMNFASLKSNILDKGIELEKFFSLLPDDSVIKSFLKGYLNGSVEKAELELILNKFMAPGNIDVNIMTKVDKANYDKDGQLSVEYNDAHAALRGFANSTLCSSVVFSAGMNPRLYSYIENFPDFFPDKNGVLKKKITLKVSDYRSALIQGKFLAKKGLWVSEYRIESGLNCGGHAFATDGYLLGPILEEFKTKRDFLISTSHEIYTDALKKKKIQIPAEAFPLSVTAQGGVGTSEEHKFLLEHYSLNSVGWGTPFLLVPEVTNVDEPTLDLLCRAKEEDLYLSNISPLGVPFNSIRGNTQDLEKMSLITKGRPGSSCPKKYLISNTEFSEKAICTASAKYQGQKIAELNNLSETMEEHKKKFDLIVEKSCLCVGLATSALHINNAAAKADGNSVMICPGPNMAYFSSVVSLREMADHIYGRINLIMRNDRPNMFIKELKLYLEYLKQRISEIDITPTKNQLRYFETFQFNISEGIQYYKELFSNKILGIQNKLDCELSRMEDIFEDIKFTLSSITEKATSGVNISQ